MEKTKEAKQGEVKEELETRRVVSVGEPTTWNGITTGKMCYEVAMTWE